MTEHVVEFKICPRSGNEVHAPWPKGVDAPVQYGMRFIAWLAYLCVQQLIPVERIGQMCEDLFGQCVSDATVQAAVNKTDHSLVSVGDDQNGDDSDDGVPAVNRKWARRVVRLLSPRRTEAFSSFGVDTTIANPSSVYRLLL